MRTSTKGLPFQLNPRHKPLKIHFFSVDYFYCKKRPNDRFNPRHKPLKIHFFFEKSKSSFPPPRKKIILFGKHEHQKHIGKNEIKIQFFPFFPVKMSSKISFYLEKMGRTDTEIRLSENHL